MFGTGKGQSMPRGSGRSERGVENFRFAGAKKWRQNEVRAETTIPRVRGAQRRVTGSHLVREARDIRQIFGIDRVHAADPERQAVASGVHLARARASRSHNLDRF
jgi:hypothetical protein